MKNYRITVNGTAYDVAVEELGAGAAPAAVAAPAPVAAAAPAPAAPAAPAAAGDVILILEAMKMENDVVAPEDGTVASINVSAGDAVEAGDVLATLN